jgi:hypothetical protein
VSEAGEQTIRRARAVHPISALQSETAAETAQLDAALPPTAGPRYGQRQMAGIDR